MKSSGTLAALLESFFIQRLMNQRQASPHTIGSYRDSFACFCNSPRNAGIRRLPSSPLKRWMRH
jgi:hypothetical protein